MEAMREHNVAAIRIMHWEGMDFDLLAPEITFTGARVRADHRKQRPAVTAKQKKVIEAERFTHALP